jgi:two-component system, NarL family, invasion response regulator UvrY
MTSPDNSTAQSRIIKVRSVGLSPIVAYGLAQLLQSDSRFCLVDDDVDGSRLPEPAEVVVSGGVETASEQVGDTWLGVPTLIVADTMEPSMIDSCLRAGALGYVHRDSALTTILEAIQSVAIGCRFVTEKPADDAPVRRPTDPLSPREMQVLTLIAQGRTHYQVARTLGISPHTVDTYVKRARHKLRLGNKADLTRAVLYGQAA